MKLTNKVAIVTGCGVGIGQGICRCLAEEGAEIAVVDVNQENAEHVADEITRLDQRAVPIIADVTESQAVKRAVTEILESFGRIDILVNNVGGEARFYQEKTGESYLEEKEWDDTIHLNLKTTMLMCQAVIPHLIQQKSGKIVNIASIGGRPPWGRSRGSGGMSGRGAEISPMMSYGVAKAGVIQFTMTLALQLAEFDTMSIACAQASFTPPFTRGALPGAYRLHRELKK